VLPQQVLLVPAPAPGSSSAGSTGGGAKAALADAQGAIHAMLQGVREGSYQDAGQLDRLKAHAAAPAAQKLSEAQAHASRLSEAASSYDQALQAGGQKVAGLLTETSGAASKVLIPLRMMRADTEQDTLALKEDHKVQSHASGPHCDPSALATKESQLTWFPWYTQIRDPLGDQRDQEGNEVCRN